jgi:hypothetical protein
MSVKRVLAAAAALRSFTVEELAAFCDEQPPAIVDILSTVSDHVEWTGGDADSPVTQWRVVDVDGLRGELANRTETSRPGQSEPRRRDGAPSATRLLLAEQTLSECAAAESAAERRVLVATAKNHLRQVLAAILPGKRPWWSVELSLQRLGEAIDGHPDSPTSTRLRLDVALACLAESDTVGQPVPARELVDTVVRFQRLTAVLEAPQLRGLVGCFFDLVMAQLAPRDRSSVPAPDRLIAAVARRRIRAQVECGVGAAMHSLVPLLENLGKQREPARVQGLYQVLGHLPDGRDRVVVYADLLQILPRQCTWQAAAELVPGALIEAVTEPAASTHLARCAEVLEHDLARSPFGSDAALIGQAVHVFQDLAEQVASLDGSVLVRSDRTRSELLTLAKAQVWRPATTPAGSAGRRSHDSVSNQ